MFEEQKESDWGKHAGSLEGAYRLDKSLESISHVMGNILFLTENVPKSVTKEGRRAVRIYHRPWRRLMTNSPEVGCELREVD